ncbi:MAG: GNAT family N-acetyltransferase [Phenylobacterium sp.]|uniref:GNAT family N-acetyltransferase n=1 Tax=Phenylobacterium sp. TaxID=1871053 RepID=UPI0025F389D1|nr:GNAT family N-acetyltransferase [Phenylobacterium sp.]MBA4013366.1 GNAT family N-acetyltransferase [Phenylobacterium sp.]
MDLDRVLALFDADVRVSPVAAPGTQVRRAGPLVLLTGGFNYVSWWDLSADTAPAAVRDCATRFRTRSEELLWRVYDHDQPSNLSACLADEGFEPDLSGTLMFFDLEQECLPAPVDGVEVRRVRSIDDLDDFVRANGEAFGQEEPWQRDAFRDRLDDPDLALFVAYVQGRPVASARLEMAEGRAFGLLFGGGVAPAHRGQGLYRALVAVRAAEAKARGLRYLSIEARDTSRPILERLGFAPAVRETTWVLRA